MGKSSGVRTGRKTDITSYRKRKGKVNGQKCQRLRAMFGMTTGRLAGLSMVSSRRADERGKKRIPNINKKPPHKWGGRNRGRSVTILAEGSMSSW